MIRNAKYVNDNIIIADGVNTTKDFCKEAQVGVDLTLKNVYDVVNAGFVSKAKTYVADYVLKEPQQLHYVTNKGAILEFEGWFLPKGSYIAETNEGCKLGSNDTAYIIQRSSLNRNNVETVSSLWDPEFTTQEGETVNTMTIRINVENEHGIYIEKNARFAQMLVFNSENTVGYGTTGSSQFQGGKTKSILEK